MKHEFASQLVCPDTNAELELEVTEEGEGEVRTGWLHARNSNLRYPITGYIPRFVDRDQYADSFSTQRLYVRKLWKYYENNRSGDAQFLPTTGFSREQVLTGMNLEIGCGYGRFIDVVQRMGGEITGIDLSTHSIELAHQFAGLRPKVHLVQADIFRLPFRERQFPRIFSIGVLHHTPDTRQAFEAVLPLLADGGQISIWVYHPDDKWKDDILRKVTVHLPLKVTYGLCIANQALFGHIRALPGGWRFPIPGASAGGGGNFWTRVMSDFDSFTPVYAFSHTHEEVKGWFESAGLADIDCLDRKTAVTGHRPR